MGTGIVLLLYGFLGVCIAIPFALAFALQAKFDCATDQSPSTDKSQPSPGRLPFILLVYGFAAFFAYAAWCEYVRGVDPGIGDGWSVPLGHGYQLVMVDQPEPARIERMRGSGDEFDEIKLLTVVGDQVAGFSHVTGAFILNTRTGVSRTYKSWDEVVAQFNSPLDLKTPKEFYAANRWGWADVASFFLLALPALWILRAWWRGYPLPEQKSNILKLKA